MTNLIFGFVFYYNQMAFVWQNPTQKLKGITQERKGVLQLNTPVFRSAIIDFQLLPRTQKKSKLTILINKEFQIYTY